MLFESGYTGLSNEGEGELLRISGKPLSGFPGKFFQGESTRDRVVISVFGSIVRERGKLIQNLHLYEVLYQQPTHIQPKKVSEKTDISDHCNILNDCRTDERVNLS